MIIDKFNELISIKPKPRVSIGMPVFNGEPFIRDAIDSLLAQTFIDFELIISDNASTDGTAAICQDYAISDKRISYVRQSLNIGPVANFQYVLDRAVGEYFMWAAADDSWSKDWLHELTLGMVNESYACSIGNICYIDEASELIECDTSHGGFLTEFPLLDQCGSALHRVVKYFLNRNDMLMYGLFRTNQAKSARLVRGVYTDLPHDQAYPYLYFILTFGSIYKARNSVISKRIHSAQASHLGPKTFEEQYCINNNHVYLTQLYLRKSCLNSFERGFLAGFLYLYLNASLIKNRKNFFL
jgi:glycosyltransferase involved in cell wall biosynthesis